MKQLSDVMVTESLAGHIYFEVETSSVGAEPQRLPMKLGLDTKTFGPENIQTRLITMESQLEPGANIGDASRLKTVTSEPQMAAVVLASDDQLALASTPELHASAKCDMDVQMQSHQAALEDTRLIPVRPITPFTATRASVKSIEERDRNPCSSPHQGLNQSEGSITVVVGSQHAPEVQTRLAGHHTDDTYQQRWRQLHTHISQKLSTLEKVQEEHQTLISSGCGRRDEKVPEGDLISAGCSGAVLQLVNESIDMLKQIVKSSDDSDVKEQLYLAVRKVLLCLDALTDLQLTPSSAGEDDVQLRMLQQECVSSQLVSVSDLLSNVESKTRPSLLGEEPDTLGCLTSLQQCLQTVQLTLSSSRDQLTQRLDLKKQHQELFLPQLCVLDEFELGQSETFPNLKDIPSLKQCVPVRHLRESPGGKAMLLEASWSLLRGISRLLELGEEEITEGQQSQVFNCTQIQAVLCRRQKFLQLLRSQLAFVQYLFQREPEALMCQEDERVKLEVRAKALQQQALEQEVAFRMRLQDRVYWKENCFQLGRALDELETIISGGELEREDYEVSVVANRRQSCQQTLAQLDESRASLGWLMDQRSMLLTKPAVFSSLVSQAGGAVELRWRSTYRQTEEEIQRCGDIQDRWARFQTNFASLSKRLTDADKHLKTCSALTDSTDQDQECIYRNLISLLDFSIEMEAMSFQRASVSQYAAQLFHLREAECPSLRMHLAQLEVSWSKLTSNVTNVQDQLQQKLLLAWPPAKLLSHLEDWLKKTMEPQLNQEKETVLKAKNAAEITQTLQRYRGLKAVMVNGQPLLDFLSQSGPPVMEADDQTLSSKYTIFAEQLGNFRLQWMLLQRELESQMHGAEQILHICADREKQLQRLHNSVEQQKKCLRQWKQPSSQTLACKVLLEWEADAGKIKEVAATLQDLKSTRVLAEKEEEHPSDVAFCSQVERVSHACEDLSQQMQSLKPTLQQTVEDWANFERNLREVSLHTTRVRSTFQYLQAPLFSVKQTGEYMDILQQLQEKEKQRKELWTDMDKSCQSLVKMLYRGTAQSLSERMEGEQKRWRDLLQELVDEHRKIGEMLSVWQEYNRLSDSFSLQLKHLWHEWEVLLNSLVSPQLDKQTIHSVEKLQNAAEDLQSRLGDVLTSSKPLISRLEPLAANLIQSQTRMLSRDILLLSQMMSEAKKSLKGDSEQHKLFHSQLKAFEKQTQNVPQSQRATMNNKDSVKQELLELSELLPSLIDVRETSGHLTLSKQETETMHTLSRRWTKSLTHMTDIYRELQAESQCTQDFQQKCEDLMCIVEELEQESTSSEAESYSNLREILVAHQKQQVEMIRGNQLLQGLLCDAVKSVEKQTGEKRSELMAKVACMKERWFRSLSLAAQRRATTKQRLSWWRVYRRGLKPLWRLLSDVEPLLHPASTALCTLQQLQSCADNCQLLEKTLGQHFTIYTQTQEAGRNLCEAMTKSESLSQLQLELQAIEEVWKRTLSLLADRKAHVDTTIKKWLQFQNRVTSITSQLEELKKQLPERPAESEQDEYIQKTGISLQHLASGLRELATMKTDLFQYVAATDSALLEQQLEQLHGQWEELCMKVSLRRQEITDRLNAWTIFNDKNKEFCDWLTQMENKVCHSADLSIEEMVEKLKKDCMEEINLFSENKSHLKQLGEQLLLASDEAKQTQVHSSLQEVNQRWHNLFLHIEARVKKLKETLVTVQKLDKNMSNLRSWLSRIEAELSRPITYSVCHHQEIQRRLAEQQELQRDIEQHTEGVASVLSLCDVLLRDEDAAGSVEVESDSLQETSHSLDQRWRTICAMALDRRLRIEETWKLWCKFLDEYSRFEDWLKIAERTAANPNTADVLYAAAKEELKKFEGFQRQVHERLTQLELVNNQYRRLARENRTDCTSQLKAMVHEGNRRWDTLHRRVAAILRRLKYFTSQREDFEGTRESMLVWLTELDLQLTNVEHFSESDVHHKIQQLSSFQKEITLNTERIDGLIVFGEGLIQKSSPQDAVLIEDELEELHSYCQEVFGRLVRFHQRLSQPRVIIEEPELRSTTFSLESSLELIGRLWLGRGQGSPPATPSHLLGSPLERSGRETPVSVDSLPLEWDHTVDVGGSSSHEDEEEGLEEEGAYFSALSEVELTETQDEFVEAPEALRAFSLGSSRSMTVHDSQKWCSPEEAERLQVDVEHPGDAPPILTSTPVKQRYLRLMSQCSDSIEDIKRISLILDEEEQPEELGLTGLTESDKQSGIIERWELLQAQSTSDQHAGSQDPEKLTSDLDDIISWLENITPELNRQQQPNLAASIDLDNMAARAKDLKEMQKMFTHYKSTMLSVNLRALGVPEHQERLAGMNRAWSQACTDLQQWDISLRKTLMQCQDFHETLHSLLLWLAHAESRRYTVDISHPETPVKALKQHRNTLNELQQELLGRQAQQASLQALWSQLQPDDGAEERDEAQEKIHVTGSKLKLLLRQVALDLRSLQQRLDQESASAVQDESTSADPSQEVDHTKTASSTDRARRDSFPHRSFFSRVLRAAFPLHVLLLLLLLLPCLVRLSDSDLSCIEANNFARSFYPMLRYTNGPPPT
ncbi:nesprin-2-like [Aulostomus maculatus]